MKIVKSREQFLKELSVYVDGYCSFAELGVLHGDFSKLILDIIKPSWLVLVDPYELNNKSYKSGLTTAYSTNEDYDKLVKRFNKEILQARVSVYKMPSYNAVSLFPNNYFDFIYHDASHLKEDLSYDLNQWLPKIKDDGIICGHDYGIEEFGVTEAVDMFCEYYNFEMFLFNENGGDWAIR